ncbi:MAG: ABC transporter ATP-binding protein [Spirochaetales bacterium]|nr:ABC transporter ATP-binding protein [Spirochaetales bacterium]
MKALELHIPTVEAHHLVHTFDDGHRGLDDVSLVFLPGSFTVMAGANGSGKTLFLKHLVGLELPDSGEVRLDGLPAHRHWTKSRAYFGLTFQDADAQILGTTVEEDVAFGPHQLGLSSCEVQERTQQALQICGLSGREKALTAVLSGGEKRRLNLAAVLALKPGILLLDEPFSGLDWPGVQAFLSVLLTLHKEGRSIILVTHDVEKCLAHAQRLVLWKDGKILSDSTPVLGWESLPQAGVFRPPIVAQQIPELTWLRSPS